MMERTILMVLVAMILMVPDLVAMDKLLVKFGERSRLVILGACMTAREHLAVFHLSQLLSRTQTTDTLA